MPGKPLTKPTINWKPRRSFESEEGKKNDRRHTDKYFEDHFSPLTTSIGGYPGVFNKHIGARALVVSYSRTGTSARVARQCTLSLKRSGYAVDHLPVITRPELPYPLWLGLSFMPGLRTPIDIPPADPRDYDLLWLVFPKWTLACPPVNSFIKTLDREAPATLITTVCGGWDCDRYLGQYCSLLERRGVEVVGSLTVERRQVGKAHLPRLLDMLLNSYRARRLSGKLSRSGGGNTKPG